MYVHWSRYNGDFLFSALIIGFKNLNAQATHNQSPEKLMSLQ
jgi:hypothetical protein